MSLLDSIIDTMELVKAGKLDASQRFKDAEIDELLEICNACGAKGSRLPVPQTAWGMSLKPMCHIHDTDYHWGDTIDDKEEADRRMKNNGCRLIRLRSAWFLKSFRRARVQTYYILVKTWGGEAFWDGKIEGL